MTSAIKTIDLLGNEELQKGTGFLNPEWAPFANTKLLAGHERKQIKGSTFDKIKGLHTSALNSAKGVKLSHDYSLPWQYDTQGKLYSSDVEQLRFKVNWMEETIKSLKDESPPPDDIEMRLVGLYNCYYCQKQELALLEAEANFKQSFACWLMGEGSPEEYKHCQWIRGVVDVPGYGNMTLREIDEELDGDYWLDNNNAVNLKASRLRFTQTLMKSHPEITHGFIENSDAVAYKAKVFIDYLKATTPKNEEEAYLWYKYIALGHPVNFDYLCEPRYASFVLNEDLMKFDDFRGKKPDKEEEVELIPGSEEKGEEGPEMPDPFKEGKEEEEAEQKEEDAVTYAIEKSSARKVTRRKKEKEVKLKRRSKRGLLSSTKRPATPLGPAGSPTTTPLTKQPPPSKTTQPPPPSPSPLKLDELIMSTPSTTTKKYYTKLNETSKSQLDKFKSELSELQPGGLLMVMNLMVARQNNAQRITDEEIRKKIEEARRVSFS